MRPRPWREGSRVVAGDAAVEGNRAEAGAAVAARHRAGDGDTVGRERTVVIRTRAPTGCEVRHGLQPDPVRSCGRRRARTAASPRARARRVMTAARRGNSVSIGISFLVHIPILPAIAALAFRQVGDPGG